MYISWNDEVEVILNDYGRGIYVKYFQDLGCPDLVLSKPFLPDKDGKIKQPLHFIALVFGDCMWMGNKLPFENTDIKLYESH